MSTNNIFSTIDSLRRNWAWFLFLGILLVILGTVAIALSYTTTLLSIFLIGVLLAAAGAAELASSFWAKEWSGFLISLMSGLLYLVIGGIFLFKPIPAAAILTLLLGTLFLVSGIYKIVYSLWTRFQHWGWIFFSGVVSTLLGVLILNDWPEASLWVIGLFIGIDLIVSGWTWIIVALSARNFSLPRS